MSKKNHVRRQRARDRKARGRGKALSGRNLALAMQEAAEWPVHRCAISTGESTVVVVAREGPEGEVVAAGFEVGDDGVYRAEMLDGAGASDLEVMADALASGSPLEEVPVDEAASAVERALVAGRRTGRQPPPEVYALKYLFGGPARG